VAGCGGAIRGELQWANRGGSLLSLSSAASPLPLTTSWLGRGQRADGELPLSRSMRVGELDRRIRRTASCLCRGRCAAASWLCGSGGRRAGRCNRGVGDNYFGRCGKGRATSAGDLLLRDKNRLFPFFIGDADAEHSWRWSDAGVEMWSGLRRA
jgi:hypothetical protein